MFGVVSGLAYRFCLLKRLQSEWNVLKLETIHCYSGLLSQSGTCETFSTYIFCGGAPSYLCL